MTQWIKSALHFQKKCELFSCQKPFTTKYIHRSYCSECQERFNRMKQTKVIINKKSNKEVEEELENG